jgi:hypothetical protein
MQPIAENVSSLEFLFEDYFGIYQNAMCSCSLLLSGT